VHQRTSAALSLSIGQSAVSSPATRTTSRISAAATSAPGGAAEDVRGSGQAWRRPSAVAQVRESCAGKRSGTQRVATMLKVTRFATGLRRGLRSISWSRGPKAVEVPPWLTLASKRPRAHDQSPPGVEGPITRRSHPCSPAPRVMNTLTARPSVRLAAVRDGPGHQYWPQVRGLAPMCHPAHGRGHAASR
jgi:hypothetical protein